MESVRLPFARAEESARMRATVAHLLTGQPADMVHDVLLVVTELVDNVVQHTGDGGELRVACGDDAVRVEVRDRSREFPCLQRPDPRRPGGRGLILVAAIAHSWGSEPTGGGKVVWAEMTPAAPRPSAALTGGAGPA
ncbi:ATP-binding protein [Actinoplanes sp. CA-030573]|uniref:ATP-binding protein n=1 Tax=Actinoplanes sp. CA-030573 TaxID=3239898 RepID=UPI003D9260EE